MAEKNLQNARMLAEILRLQRWAGGDSVSAGRIFGLMHGFESVLREESESVGVTAEVQRKVEDLLEDVEAGKQSVDGLAIKDRLRRDKVNESDASLVFQLCLLQSRFTEGVEKVATGSGSIFAHVIRQHSPESAWFGALHYVELCDSTEGVHKKLHGMFAPAVPRIGETVEPQRGSPMRVVNVVYVAAEQGDSEGIPMPILIPHVILEPWNGDDE
jgi:hypothetical protein